MVQMCHIHNLRKTVKVLRTLLVLFRILYDLLIIVHYILKISNLKQLFLNYAFLKIIWPLFDLDVQNLSKYWRDNVSFTSFEMKEHGVLSNYA